MQDELFDSWTDKYDSWFTTPIGQFVKQYETDLLLEMLEPSPGEQILDAGCGTGVFTIDVLRHGAKVTGLDISAPMVTKAHKKLQSHKFDATHGDMCALPFQNNSFDKVFSMTAIEFIPDAQAVIGELTRVVKSGGTIVVTTLNSLSPWATRRIKKARDGHALFQDIIFRSPDDMRLLIPEDPVIKTAVHFQKDDPIDRIPQLEKLRTIQHQDTGAFLAAKWVNT